MNIEYNGFMHSQGGYFFKDFFIVRFLGFIIIQVLKGFEILFEKV